jgi:hypothetical protein
MKVLQKKWVLLSRILVLVLFSKVAIGQSFQNLVPNGSFESYSLCPSNNSQIYRALPWKGPRINSSDYFNACSLQYNVPFYGGVGSAYPFYLQAKDGVAYAGIFYYKPTEDNREYAQVELIDTLKKDVCYYVEFWAANSQGPPYAANNVAANLSATWYNTTTLTVNNSILNITSHITNYGNPILLDTVKWHKISGIYEALGIEKFLVIGNFASNAQTDTVRIFRPIGSGNQAYLHLDAVSVYSLNPSGLLPWSYRDTSVAQKGDSIYIGNKMGGLNFKPQWFTQNGNYIKTNAGITVSPSITTKYFLQYTLCGVQRTDTVKVTVPKDNDVAIEKFKALNENLKLFPNPANEKLNIQCEAINNGDSFEICIFDCFGLMVKNEELFFKKKTTSIETKDLESGLYLLKLRVKNGTATGRFLICR